MWHVLSILIAIGIGLYLMLGFFLMVITAADYFQGKIRLKDDTSIGLLSFFFKVCFIGPFISILGIIGKIINRNNNVEEIPEEEVEMENV